MKKTLRLAALLLCAAMLLAGCTMPGTQTEERRVVPFEEMTYERPDVDGMIARIRDLKTELEATTSFDDALVLMEESDELSSNFYTMSTLAMLHNSMDLSDTYYDEEYRFMEDVSPTLDVATMEFEQTMVDMYGSDYREHLGDFRYESLLNQLKLISPEVEALKQKRNQLTIDYYNYTDNPETAVYDGVEYTVDDVYDMAGDYETLVALYAGYYQQTAGRFVDLYAEMIALDKEIAATLGFSSAAEMYYLGYSRDYTPEQALEYCALSREYFAPLVAGSMNHYAGENQMTMDEVFDKMPGVLATVDKSLSTVWQEMQKYDLMDYNPGANKKPGAFCTNIYDYDAPFCYGTWDDTSFHSVTTAIHEFGHFHDNWVHTFDHVVQNLDTAEIYSQGLEMLMYPKFSEFTDNHRAEKRANLAGIVQALTYQALYEEFQQKIYAMDTLDATTIGQLYAELMTEYGFADYLLIAEDGGDHTWYDMLHIFDVPFYTISYSTSAFAASQIWLESEENYDSGVKMYMNLLSSDQNQPFTQLIHSAGIADPFDEEAALELAWALADALQIRSPDIPARGSAAA